jgi:hypothetical protein
VRDRDGAGKVGGSKMLLYVPGEVTEEKCRTGAMNERGWRRKKGEMMRLKIGDGREDWAWGMGA